MPFRPKHVHFVGSIPLLTTKEVFERLIATLSGRLLRIPDGEPAKRNYFTYFQGEVFAKYPSILTIPPPEADGSWDQIGTSEAFSRPIKLNPLMYDDFAISSYKEFCLLREQGVIAPGIRFQVSLPTPFNVLLNRIRPEYHKEVEVIYTDMMLAAVRRIQDHIPAQDLAIQWDTAVEFAALEFVDTTIPLPPKYPWASRPRPWFSPLKEGIVERIVKLAAAVDKGVEMGFHFCYGDVAHKHFIEPKDSALLVEMANLISEAVEREINWIHMPVPKDRVDEGYYAPLKGLKLKPVTELYLGLVHGGDLEGTERRIEVASGVVESFGVATECGLGRTPKEEFWSALEILAVVTVQD